jgi:hypothetical protein
VLPDKHQAADVLMPPDRRGGGGGLHLGDGVHMLAPLGMRGIIEDQIHGVSPLRGRGLEQCWRLLLQRRFGGPALHEAEVIEAGPVALDVQRTASMGDMMPAPGEGHHHNQEAERLDMIPMNVVVQGTKALVKRAGHAYETKPEAMLPEPMVNGR